MLDVERQHKSPEHIVFKTLINWWRKHSYFKQQFGEVTIQTVSAVQSVSPFSDGKVWISRVFLNDVVGNFKINK